MGQTHEINCAHDVETWCAASLFQNARRRGTPRLYKAMCELRNFVRLPNGILIFEKKCVYLQKTIGL